MGTRLRPEVLGSKGGRWARAVVGWACGGKSRESISWKAGGWHWRAGRGTCSSATVCTYEATVHGKYGLINIEKAPGARSHRTSPNAPSAVLGLPLAGN